MNKILFVALLGGTLAGCATTTPGQQFTACLQAIGKNPELEPLSKKIGLNGVSSQSLEILNNKEYASDTDRPLISKWSDARNQCFVNADASMRKDMPPRLYGLAMKAQDQVKQLTSRLYAGALTYGEFAEGRQTIQSLFNQAQIDLEANAQDQAADQRRQVLLMQLQSQLNKPAPTPAPAPYMMPTQPSVNTNCTTLGNQVNCTSR